MEPMTLMLVITVIFFVVAGCVGYFIDHKDWNHGVCSKNGVPWVCVDKDSQGGRMYEAGEHTCWISWPVDWKNKKRVKRF